MATNRTRNIQPFRKLIAFVVVIVLLYGLMALTKSWAPQLGLDLRGGTTVTLKARTTNQLSNAPNGPLSTETTTPATASPSGTGSPTSTDTTSPTSTDTASPTASPTETAAPGATPTSGAPVGNWTMADAMEQARTIIQERVDSLGVGEVTVTLSGNDQIEIAAPNIAGDELVSLVGQTASLAFRNVAAIDYGTPPTPTPTDTSTDTATPSQTVAPSDSATAAPTDTPSASPSATPSTTPSAAPSTSPTPAASTAQQRPVPALPTAPPVPRPSEPTTDPKAPGLLGTLLAWQPSTQDQNDFAAWKCGDPFPDVWDQPLFACSTDGKYKYLLGPVIISGDHVTNATAGIPQGQVAWEVDLSFDTIGTKQFAEATKHLYNNYLSNSTGVTNQFAIVLDSRVISAPGVSEGAIEGGNAKITGGSIDQNGAQELARVLRYGALPLAFTVDNVDTVSATLGGEQLRAGLIAGIIGLILVLVYSAVYYRALSVIVVGSLVGAAAIIYATVVLLGQTISFALSLPGIAGIIMAIGVTADSFIVYFERIRDEVREGYSLQHAVESGWTKARGTIVIADSVQLLSAVVLFILSIGSVKGFAFTLGVTTAIDLFIVFFFSKPLMSLLARMEFYSSGHPLSGFDPAHLGVTPEQLRGRRTLRATAAAAAGKEA